MAQHQPDAKTQGAVGADFTGTERFEIRRCLGSGGMGVVYEAYDRKRAIRLALKTLRGDSSANSHAIKREFRALSEVVHPNLVALYELFVEQGHCFFTMELLEGESFQEYVRPGAGVPAQSGARRAPTLPPRETSDARNGLESTVGAPLRTERLRPALMQLAEGVAALHASGHLHCDLKPSNVLVETGGRIVLVDFGLVVKKSLLASFAAGSRQLHGTIGYLAPEQAGGEAPSESSDCYAVGCMLHEALTGSLPFVGRPAQVLRDKQALDAPLITAPDVEPDLAALCMDLLRRDPRCRPAASDILRRLGSRPPATVYIQRQEPTSRRLVGRTGELSVLRGALDDAQKGAPVIVFVRGPSGVGKTALARHWLDDLSRCESAFVVEGRCYERESLPQKALDGLVDDLVQRLMVKTDAEVTALLPKDIGALVRMFPVLGRVSAVAHAARPVVEAVDHRVLRERAAEAFLELLRAFSRDRRIVLWVDDFQWADRDGVTLLAHALNATRPPPLLVLACYREADASRVASLRNLLRDRGAALGFDERDIRLDPLPPHHALELAAECLHSDAPAGRAATIASESGGSPFLIEQLVRHCSARPLAPGTGPPALDEIVFWQLAALGLPARRLLEVVAIAGGPLAEGVALRATDPPLDDLVPLRALLTANLARTALIDGDEAVDVYHDRIRSAVLGRMDPDQRVASHLRVAKALLCSADPDPEALTLHFRAAGDREQASFYARMAAGRAAETLAFDRAASFYRLAIDVRPQTHPAESALHLELAAALANAGRGGEAADAYLAALWAPECPDSRGVGAIEVRRLAAEQFLVSGHLDEGVRELRTVLAAVGERIAGSPGQAVASMVVTLGLVRLRGEAFRERAATEVDPIELARVDACWSAAIGLGMTDHVHGAMFQMRHFALALRCGEPYRVARAFAFQAAFESTRGPRAEARVAAHSRRASALAERIGHPHAIALATLTSGVAKFFCGEWRAARERCDRGEQALRERCTGATWEIDTARLYALWSLFYLGEIRELAERVPRLQREANERGDRYGEAGLSTGLAVVAALAPGNKPIEDIQARTHEVLVRWSRAGYHVQHLWRLIADVLCRLYAGDGRRAWHAIESSWKQLERSTLLRLQYARVEARYLRAIAALGAASESTDRGRLLHAASRCAHQLGREGVPWATALGLLVRGCSAAQCGEDQAAESLLGDAAAACEGASMGLFASVARRRRGEVIAGTRGAALVAESDRWMVAQGIRSPANVAAMLAPVRRV